MRIRRKRETYVRPTPSLDLDPVDRLMVLAEQMEELSKEVLTTANHIRRESKDVRENPTRSR